MDAMKDALKKKMMSMKSKGAAPEAELEDGEDENTADNGDQAPGLGDELNPMEHGDAAQDIALMADAQEAGGGTDLIQKILMALADRGVTGREPGSLGERASAGAQGKLAELAKGKV